MRGRVYCPDIPGGEKSVVGIQETVVGRGSEAKQEKRTKLEKGGGEETTKHSKGSKKEQMERG
jgi:hypothetical protein